MIQSRYSKKMVDSKYYGIITINETEKVLDNGYITVPYVFSEHTEYSLKDYNNFMREYHIKHKYCPICGSERYTSTLMAYVLNSDKREEYKNLNNCTCQKCGDKHVYHDRVGKISATEQMCYVLAHSPAPKPMPENIVEEMNERCKEIVDMITTEFKNYKNK